MRKFKSTLENFTEYELPAKHKTKIYGGLTDGGELTLDDEILPDDPTGDDPASGTGPRGGSGGGSSSVTTAATLGNPNPGLIPSGSK